MMRLIIPTYRRVAKQRTFSCMTPEDQARTVFVADEQDAPELKARYGETGAEVIVHPPEITSIAKKRAWIIRNFMEEKIVMFDDDCRFVVQPDPNNTKSYTSRPPDLARSLIELEEKLDEYAHAGFRMRIIRFEVGEPAWLHNRRMIYVLGYRPEVLRRECELGRIEYREDMDYTLQLLRRGIPNTIKAHYGVGHYQYDEAGGCSSIRTVEASNAAAEELAKLHPGFVRITEKAYNTSTPRKEVVVSWKKAFESSQT